MISKQQNSAIHSLLSQLGLMEMKANLVRQYTNSRTASITEMQHTEANLFLKTLSEDKEKRVKKVRGKIIHLLCLMGHVKDNGDPDYNRINGFIQNIGSRNPRKKKLFYLTIQETINVCTQVEVMNNKSVEG